MFTLENKDLVLSPGEYIIMIDPIWNKSARLSPSYKDILIDIYGPESTLISPVPTGKGMKVLERALKHAAMAKSTEADRCSIQSDNDEYKDCIRVKSLDLLDCWYGLIYTKNNSRYKVKE